RDELQELRAEVTFSACDVSDRTQLQGLLKEIDPDHSLGAVIHCAAVLDDATIESASPEQLDRVFAPKVDGAWQLHELTTELDLTHFVCFSSIAGVIGSAGQGAYAAANCFLDGLAESRRAMGLAASSIAWGPWAEAGGMAGQLDEADRGRLARLGFVPLA